MKTKEQLKQDAALYALNFIQEPIILGLGTGSTVNYLIENLKKVRHWIEGAVASSKATEQLLMNHHIPVMDLNAVPEVHLYIDGADQINHFLQMIKGGGGALTREKILAAASKKFICIADEKKFVPALGENFPVAVEIIPMARGYVAREMLKLGGNPSLREGYITDNGQQILDVLFPYIYEPLQLEEKLNNITGVVAHGLFAKRAANELILARQSGVELINKEIPL